MIHFAKPFLFQLRQLRQSCKYENYYLEYLNYGCYFEESGGVEIQKFDYARGSSKHSPTFECSLAAEGCHSDDDCHYKFGELSLPATGNRAFATNLCSKTRVSIKLLHAQTLRMILYGKAATGKSLAPGAIATTTELACGNGCGLCLVGMPYKKEQFLVIRGRSSDSRGFSNIIRIAQVTSTSSCEYIGSCSSFLKMKELTLMRRMLT